MIAVVAAVQLFLAWRYFGFYTGDDVEVAAEAFRVAIGFKYRAWDIRCVFVPDVIVAPFVWLAAKLGVHSTRALVVAATIPSIIANAISIRLVHALAEPRAARVAALLFALHWIPLGFASTVYPRTIATACILGALFVRNEFAAGALCGIAFADRFSEGIFLLPLLIVRQRRWRILAGFIVTVFLVVGAFDAYTWAEWFGSIRKFAALTLVQSDFASRLKHQSVFWYLTNIFRWLAPTSLFMLWLARKERTLWLFVAIPLVALSLVAHKELRYLQTVIPFVTILVAHGSVWLRASTRRSLIVISLVWQLYGITFLAKKSMPAVMAAQTLASAPGIKTVVMSQLWAYGDRLYFTDRMNVIDVGTPPRDLARSIAHADAVCLYESDLTPDDKRTLWSAGFTQKRTFTDARARDVIVFTRSSSGTSDRARR